MVPQACISRTLNAKGGERDFELIWATEFFVSKKQNKKQALMNEKIELSNM